MRFRILDLLRQSLILRKNLWRRQAMSDELMNIMILNKLFENIEKNKK